MKAFYVIAIAIFLLMPSCAHAEWPKVYDSKNKQWVDMQELRQAMSQVNIVYVGEQHDHDWGHRVELMLLENLFATHKDIAVAMEMFERDVQPFLDGYLQGKASEDFFLLHSRPWNNYAQDYRPLVEFARSYRLPVLAANVPRRYAAHVSQGKEQDLYKFPQQEKSYMAAKIVASKEGQYYEKFKKIMEKHVPPDKLDLYFRAQCLKDDTMAESIVGFLSNRPHSAVISYAGAFHCEEYLGIVEKVRPQLPNASDMVICILPVDGEIGDPEQHSHLGDFILFAPGKQQAR